jgi:uncharacterized membrane protein YhaH (DUF805 family)
VAARTGEKLGWTGGFVGSLLWVPILAVIALGRGDLVFGVVGLVIAAIGVTLVIGLAPWRRPRTPYRRLMVPIYLVLAVAAAWAVWRIGLRDLGLSWWSALTLLPTLLPLWLAGNRRWDDGSPKTS